MISLHHPIRHNNQCQQSRCLTCISACTDDIEEHADRYINNMIMANGNYSQASCREMCLNDIKCQAAIIRGTACYYTERASVHLLFEAGTISMIIRTRCPGSHVAETLSLLAKKHTHICSHTCIYVQPNMHVARTLTRARAHTCPHVCLT